MYKKQKNNEYSIQVTCIFSDFFTYTFLEEKHKQKKK